MEELIGLFQDELCAGLLPGGWAWGQAHCQELLALLALLLSGAGWLIVQMVRLYFRRRAARQLRPYFRPAEIRDYLRYFVRTRVQSDSPDDQSTFKKLKPAEDYLKYFLTRVFQDKDETERFHLVLGGAGMGKTTFLVNLAVRHRLRQMLRPWAPGSGYAIHYLPLWDQDVLGKIKAIEGQPEAILLLDALDEDPEAGHPHTAARLEALTQAAAQFHTVIITCRTQFFDTGAQEPLSTKVYRDPGGYAEYDKMYISPFSDPEIRRYLRKRFPLRYARRQRAWKLVQDFRDLMARPMILAYIDDLLEGRAQYQYRHQVYERIVDAWIERESRKSHVPPGGQDAYRQKLLRFSRTVAGLIYGRHQQKQGQYLEAAVFEELAGQEGLDLKPQEMKSRSLLSRNAAGQWKFAHKSIMEYFLALEAYEGKVDRDFPAEFDQARRFLGDMIDALFPMVQVQGGSFVMGEGEDRHKVTLTGFWLGKFPITQRQWSYVMGDNPSCFKGDDLPVEMVSWDDAQRFIQRLNQLSGRQYRLPSEAEWEYAAGASWRPTSVLSAQHLVGESDWRYEGDKSSQQMWSGTDKDSKLEEYAWYVKNSAGRTHPVGNRKPNSRGLYDMSGNIWEWCEDCWHRNYYGAPNDGSAWVDLPDYKYRRLRFVIRGGSWLSEAKFCRVSYRDHSSQERRGSTVGFRLASSLS
ncbi:MAG: SUMF1/EgtB/PvdO family nonheme iron enzyme [Bacteroidia bacterium]|nr:SUMF1/EgtB/PvdO family nonheme iron enzyme [Bacteroidia bacterium]